LQNWIEFLAEIYFSMEKSIDSIHGSWTSAGHGPWWIDHHGRPQSSMELGRVVTPGHDNIAARRENGGGDVAQSRDCSLRLGQR
jgi:hypothetical protein